MQEKSSAILFFRELGDISRFTGKFFSQWFKPRYEISEFLRQCYIIKLVLS